MAMGYAAIITTVLLWSGFFLSLKGGAISALQPADIALTRFLLPALVMLPFVIKHKCRITVIPLRYLVGMVIGCGLPYLLIASTAMQYAPVSHGSALIPGTLPLFVSCIAIVCYQQPLSTIRKLGLTMLLIGIIVFLLSNLGSQYHWKQLYGHSLLLLGSLMWALFTISARVANLSAHVAAGFVALISLGLLIISISMGWLDSYLAQTPLSEWPWETLLGHILLQGIGAGLIASYTFLYAVRTIGAEASAAFGSLTPMVATLLAIPIFNETPNTSTWIALTFITFGGIAASNLFNREPINQQYCPPKHK
ncbi:DMT family transporter [Vibrio alfacsensis]|uniref:DMT family transporter n=1 Tax=Vibrio alfacsensis TaxID=1074311 RepID=UPI002ADDC873|nr:DMT family transporter [Vibrio alfacsensis]WQE78536.1 DMT family transporter [Vibrio alfacsensis]